MENKVQQSSDQIVSSSSEIRSAIEELSMMVKALNKSPHQVLLLVKVENSNNGHDHIDHASDHHKDPLVYVPTKPFLSLCNVLVLQVLGN